VFAVLLLYIKTQEAEVEKARTSLVGPYLALDIDFGNPMHAAMFREALNVFRPEDPGPTIRSCRRSTTSASSSSRMWNTRPGERRGV